MVGDAEVIRFRASWSVAASAEAGAAPSTLITRMAGAPISVGGNDLGLSPSATQDVPGSDSKFVTFQPGSYLIKLTPGTACSVVDYKIELLPGS